MGAGFSFLSRGYNDRVLYPPGEQFGQLEPPDVLKLTDILKGIICCRTRTGAKSSPTENRPFVVDTQSLGSHEIRRDIMPSPESAMVGKLKSKVAGKFRLGAD